MMEKTFHVDVIYSCRLWTSKHNLWRNTERPANRTAKLLVCNLDCHVLARHLLLQGEDPQALLDHPPKKERVADHIALPQAFGFDD
jgi:hypothetical protein